MRKTTNHFKKLESLIREELDKGNTRSLSTGMLRQKVKNIIEIYADDHILEDALPDLKHQITENPPHIIPKSYNRKYVIEYNLINLFVDELQVH